MAENRHNNSSTPFLAFIAVVLVVAVAVLGFFLYTGGRFGGDRTSHIALDMHPPKMPAPKRPPS